MRYPVLAPEQRHADAEVLDHPQPKAVHEAAGLVEVVRAKDVDRDERPAKLLGELDETEALLEEDHLGVGLRLGVGLGVGIRLRFFRRNI